MQVAWRVWRDVLLQFTGLKNNLKVSSQCLLGWAQAVLAEVFMAVLSNGIKDSLT